MTARAFPDVHECDLSVIIPAFNEARRIGPTLEAINVFLGAKDFRSEILVVDDGSTDGTLRWVRDFAARSSRCRVISYEPNRGKGFAVRSGVMAARGAFILFCDADHAVSIETIDQFLPLLERSCDVVVGSRYVPGSRVVVRQPLYRILWSRIGSALIRRLVLPGIRDVYCGFKCFRRQCAKDVFARQRRDGLTFDIETLALARHLGFRIIEVPVTWRDDRDSRLSPWKEACRGTRDLLLIKWDQMRGWPQSPGPGAAEPP